MYAVFVKYVVFMTYFDFLIDSTNYVNVWCV